MKDAFRNDDWEARLRPFDRVWNRVQGPRPPFQGPPPPPFQGPPPPPGFGPPPPPPVGPPPPFMPGNNCRSKAVRFNPHRRK